MFMHPSERRAQRSACRAHIAVRALGMRVEPSEHRTAELALEADFEDGGADSVDLTGRPADSRARFAEASSLGQLLALRALDSPERGVRFIASAADTRVACEGERVSYAQLLELAQRAAGRLQRAEVGPGDRVLLVLPTGLAFAAAFFGCQLLGAVPVPVTPPWNVARLGDDLARITRIAQTSGTRFTIVAADLYALLTTVVPRMQAGPLDWPAILFDHELLDPRMAPLPVEPASAPGAHAIAMIQFTSGSTDRPKGVVLSQNALLSNARAIGRALQFAEDDVCCTWLPLYHDLGLIGHLITPLAWGLDAVLIASDAFALRPWIWLETMARHRCTISSATNYGYSVCARQSRRTLPAAVDLSAWRVALCAGEGVQPQTLANFASNFAAHGFRAASFFPWYGLAEFTLAATLPALGRELGVDCTPRTTCQLTGAAHPAPAAEAGALEFVAVGEPLPGAAMCIGDAAAEVRPERAAGDIERLVRRESARACCRGPEA